MSREIKTWSQLRKIKVLDKGLIGYDIKTVGDFLEVGEFEQPHGRTEFLDLDLYKVLALIKSQRVVLDIDFDFELDINEASVLVDWLDKLNTFFKLRGIACKPIKCNMVVNLGLVQGVEPCDLSGCEMVDLLKLTFLMKDDVGCEDKYNYYFDYLNRDSRSVEGMFIDFLKSPYWYEDYITCLYSDMLSVLLEKCSGRLACGKPVSRIVDVLEDELLNLERLSSKRVAR